MVTLEYRPPVSSPLASFYRFDPLNMCELVMYQVQLDIMHLVRNSILTFWLRLRRGRGGSKVWEVEIL